MSDKHRVIDAAGKVWYPPPPILVNDQNGVWRCGDVFEQFCTSSRDVIAAWCRKRRIVWDEILLPGQESREHSMLMCDARASLERRTERARCMQIAHDETHNAKHRTAFDSAAEVYRRIAEEK